MGVKALSAFILGMHRQGADAGDLSGSQRAADDCPLLAVRDLGWWTNGTVEAYPLEEVSKLEHQ